MRGSNNSEASSTSTTVTQADLARFKELQPMVSEFMILQERLRRLLDEEAKVEDGEYVVEFYVCEEKKLTVKKMIAALDLTYQQVGALVDRMPVTQVRHLGVYPRLTKTEKAARNQSLVAVQSESEE